MSTNAHTDAEFIHKAASDSTIKGRKGMIHITKLPLAACQSGGLDLAIAQGWVQAVEIDGKRYLVALDRKRPANPADEGVEAAAYICERCEEETADTFAWDDEAERLYTATGEVVRGEWYPICHECNDARQA